VPFRPIVALLFGIIHLISLFLLGLVVKFGFWCFFDTNEFGLFVGIFCIVTGGVFFLAQFFMPTITASNINRDLENVEVPDLFSETFNWFINNPYRHCVFWLFSFLFYLKELVKEIINKKNFKYSFSKYLEIHYAEDWEEHNSGWNDDSKVIKNHAAHIFGTEEKIQHPNILWIFLINLFLGATVVFWLAAYIWACSPGKVNLNDDESSKSTNGNDICDADIDPQKDKRFTERLNILKELFDNGSISKSEFEREKERILREL
ncbi:superinfection immunity protein, partial [Alphaproteobacteria bacterium]|nr:superinfection immunity protein [Alphaproteobacteria bacterium]